MHFAPRLSFLLASVCTSACAFHNAAPIAPGPLVLDLDRDDTRVAAAAHWSEGFVTAVGGGVAAAHRFDWLDLHGGAQLSRMSSISEAPIPVGTGYGFDAHLGLNAGVGASLHVLDDAPWDGFRLALSADAALGVGPGYAYGVAPDLAVGVGQRLGDFTVYARTSLALIIGPGGVVMGYRSGIPLGGGNVFQSDLLPLGRASIGASWESGDRSIGAFADIGLATSAPVPIPAVVATGGLLWRPVRFFSP